MFLPVKFVPVVGYLIFASVAGFTTALSLLDGIVNGQDALAVVTHSVIHHL